MKRFPLLLTIGFLFLVGGGYYLYYQFFLKPPVRPWDLVPAESVFVYEKDACQSCIDEIKQSPVWTLIQRASYYSKPFDTLRARLNHIIDAADGLMVSAHVTRKDDFDFVFYLPHAGRILEPVVKLSQVKGYRYSERELNSVTIHELSFRDITFSWIVIGEVWAGSFTPFLIEDVIRTYREKPSFSRVNADVRKLPRISGDAGNLYIQLRNFSEWLSVFVPGSDKSFAIGKSSLLDLKAIGDHLVLNGFSLDSTAWTDCLLSVFRNQSPVPFTLKNYVPNRTIMFTSYGIDDAEAFASDLHRFVDIHQPALRQSQEQLAASLKLDWQDLYREINNEIGVCVVEGIESRQLAKIVMIETKAPEVWIRRLDEMSEKLSADTVFHERFSHYQIREIPEPRFAEKLLWPLVEGFDQTFYTSFENMILMGDNLEELKYFLEDFEHEDVWGRSVSKNQFLESTLLESNVSLFVNTARIWNFLLPDLRPRWKQFVLDNQSLLHALQMSAFQFSHLNNTFYTNLSIGHREGKSDVAFASTARRNVVHFEQPIQKIYAVKSHINRENEILIQDSLNDVSLVTMEGKVLWKIPIGDQITSDVRQIDFYNNGKLQYIFSTHDAIHVLDRLGNYVPPYPLYLKGKDIEYLSVADYDRSKRYRILIAERNGKIWMYDKSGNNLDGWNPNDAGAPLAAPPMHHRIKGRDFIIAMRKDGLVNLYNRRGEMLKNFPLDVQGTPMGDYFLEMGADLPGSYFVVVTRDGYRVRFNTEGKIQSRETLLRASVASQFRLISEGFGKSYLVVQNDARQLTVTDPSGKKIFTNDDISMGNWDLGYYDFGSGRSFISLTDRVQQLSYVFDGSGNLITRPPLQSRAIELRMANSDETYVFFIHGKALTIQPLKP